MVNGAGAAVVTQPGTCERELLVFWVHGTTDEDGGEKGENVSLQEGNADFEASHDDEHEERQDSDWFERCGVGSEQRVGQDAEGGEQDVASQNVGEQTNGEGERTNQERRDELNWSNQDVKSLGNSRREQCAFEVVTEALRLDTGTNEDEPNDQ
jgi:hypothetical protein